MSQEGEVVDRTRGLVEAARLNVQLRMLQSQPDFGLLSAAHQSAAARGGG